MIEDNRTVICLENCNVLLHDVFLPLIMADLNHLAEVYMDYRRQQLLKIFLVCFRILLHTNEFTSSCVLYCPDCAGNSFRIPDNQSLQDSS